MFNVTVITLGKLKEAYWQEAEAEYLKRLKPFVKINLIELREESFSEKDKIEIIKQKEADKIKNTLDGIKNKHTIVLDEHGQQFSSTEFSKQLTGIVDKVCPNLVFVIGGPLGLSDEIIKQADLKISFSKLTFTHQMIRVFLLEQLYRAEMIAVNRKYHY